MAENALDKAKQEFRRGSYSTCLKYARESVPRNKDETDERNSLICACLQYNGDYDASLRMAQSALEAAPNGRFAARYWATIGRLRLEQQRREDAANAFRRGIKAADRAADLVTLSALQQLLLTTLAQTPGTALTSAVRDAYHTAIRTADFGCLTAFHLRLARLEGHRGAFDQANHHLSLAESLLERSPNPALSALLQVNRACVLGTIGALSEARRCAELGASLAEQAGHLCLAMLAAINVSHNAIAAGELSVAEPWLRKAKKAATRLGITEIPLLECFASYALVRHDFAAASAALGETRRALEATNREWMTFAETDALLTELYLHKKLGNDFEHERVLRLVREITSNQSNWQGNFMVTLAEAESSFDQGEPAVAADKLRACVRNPPAHVVHSAALSRLMARSLWTAGHKSSARRRLARAATGFYGRGSRLAWTDTLRDLQSAGRDDAFQVAYSIDQQLRHASAKFPVLMNHAEKKWFDTARSEAEIHRNAWDGFDDAIAIVEAVEHPELLGREALASMIALDAIEAAALITRTDTGPRPLATFQWSKPELDAAVRGTEDILRLEIGRIEGRAMELLLRPKPDLRSASAIAGLRRLLDATKALEAQKKHQQRLGALWQPEVIIEEPDAVFSSPQTIELMQTVRKVAPTTLPVLLMGPTGTGKEVVARAIHRASPRAGQIFLPFNCSAVPRDMIESQLFGSKRGAFTGATDDSLGVIRTAEGGTLFLDEIGELSMDLQPKLLRFLETNEVHPLGEGKPIKVDVRVIAATNADLEEMIQQKTFREDLYYRLNIVRFHMPTLAERREEIPALATHLLRRFEMDEKKHSIKISDELMEYLLLYKWPGNVRQLSNELRKMVAMVNSGDTLLPEHIAPAIRATRKTVPVAEGEAEAAPLPEPPAQDPAALTLRLDQPMPGAIEALERAMIEHAIARADGKIEEAARLLGISRKGLFLKRRRWHTGGEPPSHSA